SKGRLETGAAGGDARSQQNEIGEQPATDGQRLNLRGADHLADLRARRLYGRRLGRHNHLFRARCDFHGDINGGGLSDGQEDTRLGRLREGGGLGRQFVSSGGKAGQDIQSVLVRNGRVGAIRFRLSRRDGSFRDRASAL